MATNQLYPFATGAGSNVEALADYLGSAARQTGFQAGVAPSARFNRAFRQALFAASALGKFAADNSAIDTLDDGNVDNFAANIKTAVEQLILSGGGQKVHYGVDTSATANTIVCEVVPVITSLNDGEIFEITVKNTTTITTPVINVHSLGNKNIVRNDGSALLSAELVAGAKYLFAWDGTLQKFVLLSPTRKYIDQRIADNIVSIDLSGYLPIAGGAMLGPLYLSGNPTADSMAANKLYVDQKTAETHVFGNAGYQKLPSGLIIQWLRGNTDPASGDEFATTYSWPLAFPTACFGAWVSMNLSNATQNASQWYQTAGFSQSSVIVFRQDNADDNWNATTQAYVFGIGY